MLKRSVQWLLGLTLFVGLLFGWMVLPMPPVMAQTNPPGIPVRCQVVNNNATTLTAFASPCSGLTAGTALFITAITASASAIATTSADAFLELKFGSGGSCASGTTVIWAAYNLAFAPVVFGPTLTPAMRVPAGNDLCWMDSVAGSKTFIVDGYLATQ